MPEFLAGVDIGQVNFHNGHFGRGDRIAECDAGMRVACGVDYDHISLADRILDPGDQSAFVIALAELNVRPAFGLFAHGTFNVRQRGRAVDFWLPLPQQVEVGAVEEENLHRARS